MALIFISHSSRDEEQATRLIEWLRVSGFTDVFLDFDRHSGIKIGSDWERKLYSEMSRAEAVILVLTQHWFDSKWCFAEFTFARMLGKPIFPIVETPIGEPTIGGDIQSFDLVKDRDGGLEQLSAELTRVVLDARGGFSWDQKRPPYPGLLAFTEEDAAIYFGRDDDSRRVIERLNARRAQGGAKLVLLLGASGSGKSSLLRAGVLPRLKRDRTNWIILPPFRPQLHPIDELAQAIATRLGAAGDWRQWRDALSAESPRRSLLDLARDLRATGGANEARILLSIDQGEELFGISDKQQAASFFRLLNLALDEHLPFLVLMGLRSDYLGLIQQAPGLDAPFEEFSLKPMPTARWRDIIVGPARVVASLTIEDALVGAAIADAATGDALPLLAFALRVLYDRFGAAGNLTVAEYRALGDEVAGLSPLENAVRRSADEVLQDAKPGGDELAALKDAFVPAMVRVNAEGEYVRRPARKTELPLKALPLIKRLADARLLVEYERDGQAVVEVAHEALLRKWPLLRGWLDEEREFLIGEQQLEQDLHDWENAAQAQKAEALLSGLKLTRARNWLAAKPRQLSEAERIFISDSIARNRAENARRERLRRRVTVSSIAAIVVLALLSIFAVAAAVVAERQRNDALIAQSRFLARDALLATNRGDAVLGMLYALEALPWSFAAANRPFVVEAEYALENAFGNQRERLILSHQGPVGLATYSPDGTRIVTASYDRTARVWDANTGAPITIMHHDHWVTSAVFSPDGTRVVTASWEGAAVWDAKTGALIAVMRHGNNVASALFSPDGADIVTASSDKTARVWDAKTGVQIVILHHDNLVFSAAYSPDGTRIVTASADRTARIWDAKTGAQIVKMIHDGIVISAAYSLDGARILTVSADKTARVWDAKTGSQIALMRHEDDIVSAAFSPDGTRIVTASLDKTARVWDVMTGVQTILVRLDDRVTDAAFSPNGMRIITASDDDTSRVWDAKTGAQIVLMRQGGAVTSAVFSPDGTHILTASADMTARVWDAKTSGQTATMYQRGAVTSAIFSSDGKRIATASADRTARVWDALTGAQIAIMHHGGAVTSAVFSLDGKRIVTVSDDNTTRVWDALTGAEIVRLHHNGINSAGFSPDGMRIVTASDDGTAQVWDAKTGTQTVLMRHEGGVDSAAFSPDGTRIVTASRDNTARIWNATTGTQIAVMHHDNWVTSALFSSDGTRIVTASWDKTARVWDTKTGAQIAVMRHDNLTGLVDSAVFSPDGTRIVTASGDKTVRVWDANTGAQIAVTRYDAAVHSAVFSPDSARILTASELTVRVWDAKSGAPIALMRHDDQVNAAAYSPDGTRIVSASADKTVRVWSWPHCQALIDQARIAVPRQLSKMERAQEFIEASAQPPLFRLYLFVRPLFAFALPTFGAKCE